MSTPSRRRSCTRACTISKIAAASRFAARSRRLLDRAPERCRGPSRLAPAPAALVAELRRLMNESRERAAWTVNSGIVWLYWRVGSRLRRTSWARAAPRTATRWSPTSPTPSPPSTAAGSASATSTTCCGSPRFSRIPEIVHALRAQLGWTHLRATRLRAGRAARRRARRVPGRRAARREEAILLRTPTSSAVHRAPLDARHAWPHIGPTHHEEAPWRP